MAKIKALKSFSGLVSMVKGEVRDIEDDFIVNDLIRSGYCEDLEVKATKSKAKSSKGGEA